MPTPTQLRRALASQTLPCPACRYDLRGNESLICPECGTPISRARPAPSVAAWRVGLAGMLTTYACLAALVALQASRAVSGSSSGLLPALFAALFLLSAPGRIRRWRRTRRALGHQPPHLRQQRAAAWCAAALLTAFLLAAFSRTP